MAVKVEGVAPGLYVDRSDNFLRYQVLNSGEVLVRPGVLTSLGLQSTGTPDPSKYAGIPDAPSALTGLGLSAPLKTAGGLYASTTQPKDKEGLPQPGGGKQTEAFREKKPEQAADFDQERAVALTLLEPYRVDGGYDLSRAIREGVKPETLFQAGIRQSDIDNAQSQAAEYLRQEEARNAFEIAQQEEQTAAALAREDATRRIDAAGGLVQALFSDNEAERITREQALRLGYTEEQIEQAIADEVRYVAELTEYERAVREQAEEQRAAATAEPIADAPPEDTAAYDAFIARLSQYPGEEPETYQAGVALASGAITEAEARAYFGERADTVIAQAATLRAAADAGFYADGSLVPESLRSNLLLRSADMSAELARLQNLTSDQLRLLPRASVESRIRRLKLDIGTIDTFLDQGGLVPDYQVNVIARDIRTLEQQLADRNRELESAVELYGERDEATNRIRALRDNIQRDLDSRNEDLLAAVARAETDPITTLRTDPPFEAVARYLKEEPDAAYRKAVEEAYLFAAGSVATTFAVRAAGALYRLGSRAISTQAGRSLELAAEELRTLQQNARLSQLLRMERDNAAKVGELVPTGLSTEEESVLRAALRDNLSAQVIRDIESTGVVPVDDLVRALTPSQRAWFASLSAAQAGALLSSAIKPEYTVETPDSPVTEPDVAPFDPEPSEPFDIPSPVRPVVIPQEEPEPDDDFGTVPSPVEPVVIPVEPDEVPFTTTPGEPDDEPVIPVIEPDTPETPSSPEPTDDPLGVPVDDPATDPLEVPGEETSPAPTESPLDVPVTSPTTSPSTEPAVSPRPSRLPGVAPVISPVVRPGPRPGDDGVPESPTDDPLEVLPFPGTSPSPATEPGTGDAFDTFTPTPTGNRRRARPKAPTRGVRGGKAKPKTPQPKQEQINTEWVGRKSGFGYKYNNLVTGDEMFSLRGDVFGKKVPDAKGKGAAKRSYTRLTSSRKPARYKRDEMGLMDVHLNGAPRFRRRPRRTTPRRRRR